MAVWSAQPEWGQRLLSGNLLCERFCFLKGGRHSEGVSTVVQFVLEEEVGPKAVNKI